MVSSTDVRLNGCHSMIRSSIHINGNMLSKNLIILDLECTGESADTYDIIQIGAVKLDGRFDIIDRFECLVAPFGDVWEEGAYKVHNIEFDFAKKNGKDLKEALMLFESWFGNPKEHTICTWGAFFDIDFLIEAYKKVDKNYPFSRRTYDIASIVRFVISIRQNLGKKCGEFTCAKKLGIEVDASKLHNALYDAELSALNLNKVYNMIKEKL